MLRFCGHFQSGPPFGFLPVHGHLLLLLSLRTFQPYMSDWQTLFKVQSEEKEATDGAIGPAPPVSIQMNDCLKTAKTAKKNPGAPNDLVCSSAQLEQWISELGTMLHNMIFVCSCNVVLLADYCRAHKFDMIVTVLFLVLPKSHSLHCWFFASGHFWLETKLPTLSKPFSCRHSCWKALCSFLLRIVQRGPFSV